MKWTFWLSLLFIAFTYVGYPSWLYVRSRGFVRPARPTSVLPFVSIVMAVHNEQETLDKKLRNLAEIDYPPDLYEIVVVSDGSSDGTNEILMKQARATPCLSVLVEPTHEGKAAALNQGVQAARGDILVFTDTRQVVDPQALKHLVADLADPKVGCVSGDIGLGDPSGSEPINGLGLYWRIETKMREWEGRTGSLVGAAGCLYAIRKDLVVPLPAGTILDDVYLPLHAARQGAQVILEPQARGWDCAQSDWRREFRRKVRTLTGNYQLLQLAPWLLTRANPVRFEFVCHKMLRLLVPFAILGVLVSSLSLHGAVYKSAVALQLICYLLAALAACRFKLGWVSRGGDVSLAFLALNAAAVVALIHFAVGKKQVWVR